MRLFVEQVEFVVIGPVAGHETHPRAQDDAGDGLAPVSIRRQRAAGLVVVSGDLEPGAVGEEEKAYPK